MFVDPVLFARTKPNGDKHERRRKKRLVCLSHGSVSLCLVSRRVRVGEEEEVWRGHREEQGVANISTKPMGSFQLTSLVGS